MPDRAQRRLAAIVAADVAGYSRLVGTDEEGTLAAIRACRSELVEPLLTEYGGRIANTAGDSYLLEFASAVDALRCALALQAGMASRNHSTEPDCQLHYRIGINVGDVVADGVDLLGDGVNVAARLEGLAEPGGIVLSRAARDQIRDRLDVALEDLGEVEVKNIARPVRAFRIRPSGDAASAAPQRSRRPWRWPALIVLVALLAAFGVGAWWLQHSGMEPAGPAEIAEEIADKPSVVVLPLENISGDPEQEYFADGMTEDLITDLSKISGLFVIGRNSAFFYKHKVVDPKQVADELGVRYVLEGSVRRAGDRVRINARLSDAATGGQLWADRFDRELADIFAVQDDVSRQIAAALAVTLTPEEHQELAVRGTDVAAAYDAVLRGRQALAAMAWDRREEARGWFEKAVELDPGYARAHANLGLFYLNEWEIWGQGRDANLALALQAAEDAAALDPLDPAPQVLLARVHQFRDQFEPAARAADRAIALHPSQPEVLAALGAVLLRDGRPEQAERFLRRAMRLDPYYPPIVLAELAWSYIFTSRYDEAIAVLREAIADHPDYIAYRLRLAQAYAALGRDEEARQQVDELLRINPRFTLSAYRNFEKLRGQADWDRDLAALRRAGLPE